MDYELRCRYCIYYCAVVTHFEVEICSCWWLVAVALFHTCYCHTRGIIAVEIPAVNFARFFVSKGAVVDKIGGDLKSTPLHWATRFVKLIVMCSE